MNMLSLFTFGLLNSRNPITIVLVLALFALGLATPFAVILRIGGYERYYSWKFYVFAPVFEEIFFRMCFLLYFLAAFDTLTAILISTVIYTIYMNIVYGTPAMAEGIVTGILYGFAFLQLGIVPVIVAHIIYRAVLVVW